MIKSLIIEFSSQSLLTRKNFSRQFYVEKLIFAIDKITFFQKISVGRSSACKPSKSERGYATALHLCHCSGR